MRDETIRLIERHEGRKGHVYTDSVGHPTIGVGFNLDRAGARERIEQLGLDYDKVRSGQQDLTDQQIDALRNKDIEDAESIARRELDNFDELSPDRKDAMTDMAFNLGAKGFAGFKKMIDAVESEDWDRAIEEMKNSKWAQQVGTGRVTDDVDLMSEDDES